jgi:hypothetical protein
LGAGGVFPDRKVGFINLDVQVELVQVELVQDGLGFDGGHAFSSFTVIEVRHGTPMGTSGIRPGSGRDPAGVADQRQSLTLP